MSLLAKLREAPDEEIPVRRWLTLLDEDPSIDAPKFEVEIEYLDADEWDRMARKYRRGLSVGLNWVQSLNSLDKNTFLRKFFKRVVKDWRGLGRKTLPQLCSSALENLAAVRDLPDDIPFSDDVRDDLATMVTHENFLVLQMQATDIREFGIAMQQKKMPSNDEND